MSLSLSADFFNTEKKLAQKAKIEKEHLCNLFTQKAIKYEKTMREDKLAQMTLFSYKKRASIYCSKGEKKVKKVAEKKIDKSTNVKKNIALEDKRLCKIFKEKIETYKKNIRDDELARTTLKSYQKRATIFCSKDSLEKKEKNILREDEKLCEIFKQGPKLCKLFNKKIVKEKNDTLAKITLQSYEKRTNIFCSSKPLHEKDQKVYEEHKRLCQLFNKKIISYKKNIRDDELARATLKSYQKRASYFCSDSKN